MRMRGICSRQCDTNTILFALHFLITFLITAVVIIHLLATEVRCCLLSILGRCNQFIYFVLVGSLIHTHCRCWGSVLPMVTLSRTPLDERSVRRRGLPVPSAGFGPAIAEIKRPQEYHRNWPLGYLWICVLSVYFYPHVHLLDENEKKCSVQFRSKLKIKKLKWSRKLLFSKLI
jgi:hypothetical protein